MREQPLDETVGAFLTSSRALVAIAVRSIDTAPVEVTVTQHRVLVLLAARGALTNGDIAAELNVNPSNATRHCDRLERAGLVRRTRSAADRRVVEVVLTDLGRDVVDAVTRARRAEIRRVVERMDPDDAARAVAALRAFTDAAHELRDAHESSDPHRRAYPW